jgi:hypothetical protein
MINMAKYTYLLFGALLVGLFLGLAVLGVIETPIVERANLPRCDSGIVIDSELKYGVINYANERIIQGTGDSYFNNHFIYKTLDYSTVDCTFIIRYEYTYNELHSNMDMTLKASSKDKFDIININSFLRPVNLLVTEKEALEIAEKQNMSYSYYNVEIEIEQQSFKYKFYRETMTEGVQLVLVIDGQSKEMMVPKNITPAIPLV